MGEPGAGGHPVAGLTDFYAGAAPGWAAGATKVYGPLARDLVAHSPHPLQQRLVLDVGAGTGAGSAALRSAGARPVAVDLSHDMLAWDRSSRPPSAVSDVLALPFPADSFDDVVAAFVLNHLVEPVAGLRELARVTSNRGAILATAYSTQSASEARERVDDVARSQGWEPPGWYVSLKSSMAPLVGSAASMQAVAREAGLAHAVAGERPVDTGVRTAGELVDYRFGQAHYAEVLASLTAGETDALRRAALAAAEPVMEPYRPIVVFLTAIVGE